MFEVIIGGKIKKENIFNKKVELYKQNYYSNLYSFSEEATKEKAVFYGVKYISKYNLKKVIQKQKDIITKDFLESKFDKKISDDKVNLYFNLLSFGEVNELNSIIESYILKENFKYHLDIQDIKTLMCSLTYREFINIFPIIKDYDGVKFECKDYFCVIDYVNKKGIDNTISMDDIDDFLWSYYNNDIMFFVVNEISCVDTLSVMNGGDTLLNRFLKDVDKENKIHTYTYYEDDNCLQDNVTGEIIKAKPVTHKNKNFKRIK